MNSHISLGTAAWLLLAITFACGGSGGGSSTASGVFLDSPVQGLSFSSGTESGTTDAAGTFTYPAGSTVEFSIGGTVLGSAPGAASITPVSLVAGAADENDATVTNILRLLQTLDSDRDPSNGIVLADAVRTALQASSLNFAQSVAAFEADATVTAALSAAGAGTLVTTTAARSHFRGTLLARLAGRYRGTFTGNASGTFSFVMDRNGRLLGWGVESQELFNYTGTTASDGSSVFGSVSTGATFSGTTGDGAINGTWSNSSSGESGTFTGTQVESIDVSIDGSTLQQIMGTYSGSATIGGMTDPVTLILDSAGNVTVPPVAESIAVLVGTTATGARLLGTDLEATDFAGTFDLAGNVSGTLTNTVEGQSGSFQVAR
ncbi:MAG: hypothetical protein AAF628_37925 [Planctomycetota bacterium]